MPRHNVNEPRWCGVTREITIHKHVFAYRSRWGMPCTGPRVCIYCGVEAGPDDKDWATLGPFLSGDVL